MNSKQRVIAVLEGKTPDCTPAGFSLHFPVEESAGQAGVESHGPLPAGDARGYSQGDE